ncbi:class I SAM-dependent methyltransferase [Tenggerimyces flavus]|uniref:Class I SAM-dependent methyltransferase n=1 Tax=Tenggerimyces flavus TaxID=1708749 RepID=A0ABV7Y412_9ACTN|nr:class I SAM-dependent methyltransferase [Tenggerimyces flavus]MBM7790594.1 SAM-dependent methyltransferase [Tenggerimyces flavus]
MRDLRSVEDVLRMLDGWFAADAAKWDQFYADREKPIPFFVAKPDESLASWLSTGVLPKGRALDLGCGHGRNAIALAQAGFDVDAVDLSSSAIEWGKARAAEASVDVRFHQADIFTVALPHDRYDLVYDSGCLHHLPPHRRVSYRDLIDRVLEPGGHFGLVCFAAGAMGSERTDEELYRAGSLEGGLAYDQDSLRWIFSDYTEVELRPMAEQPDDAATFGKDFLLTALFRR